MPLAKKCSRCGKLYEHYPKGLMTQYNSVRRLQTRDDGVVIRSRDIIDLCPECMSSFDRWMIEGGKFDD